MPSSLFAPDFQAVVDQAKEASGQASGPFPSPEDWRDAQGVARPAFDVIENIPAAQQSCDAFIWPAELPQNHFFRRQGLSGGGDDTVGDFSVLKQMLTADRDVQR